MQHQLAAEGLIPAPAEPLPADLALQQQQQQYVPAVSHAVC
jgi:hypothetical protein